MFVRRSRTALEGASGISVGPNQHVRRADLRRHLRACRAFRLHHKTLKSDCPAPPQPATRAASSPTRADCPAPPQPATRAASSPDERSRLPSSLVPHDESERSTRQLARLIAVVAGVAGVLLCGLVPLLPVKQTTATILWPQGLTSDGHVTDITAPLVAGAPRALDISIPCAAIATLPADGGLVLSTLPVNGFQTGKHGLLVRANEAAGVGAFRDSVAEVAPRPAVGSGACSVLHIWADD